MKSNTVDTLIITYGCPYIPNMFGFESTALRAISLSFEKGAFWKSLAEIMCQKFLEKRKEQLTSVEIKK